MKKIIPFTNDIKFNTKIYEITSISLEHNLKLKENNLINGDFIISGDYRITDSSINNEPFINSIPFDIELDKKYDTNKVNIDIDDFNYEVINDEILRININVKIDGVELLEIEDIKPDIVLDERNNNEYAKKTEDLFKEESEVVPVIKSEEKEEKKEDIEEKKVTSIFDNFNDDDENYVTYYVHIIRENDNLDELCTKYKITKEEIKEYNEIDNLTIGNKIIIPYINESI